MKRCSSILLILIFTISHQLFAQDSLRPKASHKFSLKDKLVYGGNMGLRLGNLTYFEISPQVGYKLSERFIPGVGATYRYIRWNYPGYSIAESTIYGGSIWGRYFITENIFAYGEYEVLSGEWDPFFRPGSRYEITSILVGGGYRQRIGFASTYILVLLNLNDSVDSPYVNPIIRVGLGFGM